MKNSGFPRVHSTGNEYTVLFLFHSSSPFDDVKMYLFFNRCRVLIIIFFNGQITNKKLSFNIFIFNY